MSEFKEFCSRAFLTKTGKIIVAQNATTVPFTTYLNQPFNPPVAAKDSESVDIVYPLLQPTSPYPTFAKIVVAEVTPPTFIAFLNSTMPGFYVAMRRDHAYEFGERFLSPLRHSARTYLTSLKSNTEQKTKVLVQKRSV